jgi:hypothetical protein
LVSYANTPGVIASLISARLATLNELQTVYGAYDAYQMIDIHRIDAYNTRKIREAN